MNRVFFYIQETFKSIFRNKNTSFATVISMSTALIILGITLIVVLNINNFVITSKREFSGVQIFVKNTVSQDELHKMKMDLEENKDLRDISFVSKEEIMKNFIKNMGSDATLFSDIENPCENSFIVYIKNPENANTIVENIKKNKDVSSISYYQDTIDTMIKISKVVSIISICIIVVLFVLSLLIIENMIKITIFSRIREVNIMKNIGATNWFIRWPFILEGAILGFIGSSISFFILDFIYSYLYSSFGKTVIFAKYLVNETIMTNMLLSVFLPTGIGIGIIGAIISLRKYLKV